MGELVRGNIQDRPWGQTFGRLGSRGLSGQLDIVSDGKRFSVAFERGAVVAAFSPLANDAMVRIALTGNLITSTQVSDIMRRIAAAPQRDELEIIGEAARISADHLQRLRRRAVAQRAARTFSLETGEFVVTDRIALQVVPGSELDVRAVMYMGARGNLTEQRLDAELEHLGSWFKLKPEAVADLAQYGFTDVEKSVLHRLVTGTTLHDLLTAEAQLDGRVVRGIVYALASYGAVDTAPPTGTVVHHTRPTTPPASRTSSPSVAPVTRTVTPRATSLTSTPPARPRGASEDLAAPRAASPSAVPVGRTPTPHSGPHASAQGSGGVALARTQSPNNIADPSASSSSSIAVARTKSGSVPAESRTKSSGPIAVSRTKSSNSVAVSRTKSSNSVATQLPTKSRTTSSNPDTERLIVTMVPMLDRNADHFELLGLAFEAPVEQVRAAYFQLARKLHPDKLAALGLPDTQRQAQRLFAQINTAFAVLTDPVRRQEYIGLQKRGGVAAVKAEENQAEALANRVLRAEEAFKQGEMALRREQFQQAVTSFMEAVELEPNEPEYQALLAWAKFTVATDKNAVAHATRAALQKAADADFDAVTARFYLGRVERMLGREKEALQHFQAVLMLKPGHSEASSEARVLEQRLRKR
jgi:curved DNA-binding protein CbpA